MPYRVALSADLLTAEFSGTLTRDDLFSALQEMEEAEQKSSRAPNRLFLLFDVLEWHIDGNDIRRHAERRRAARLPNPIRSAILVQNKSHEAVARVFALLANEIPHITVQVFTTTEEAYAWLGVF